MIICHGLNLVCEFGCRSRLTLLEFALHIGGLRLEQKVLRSNLPTQNRWFSMDYYYVVLGP